MTSLYRYIFKGYLFTFVLIILSILLSVPSSIYGQATKLPSGFYLPSKDEGGYFQFGCLKDNKGNCTGNYHLAVDRKCKEGDPVYAVADGEIVWYSSEVCGYLAMDPHLRGGAIVIRHVNSEGEPFYALYGHIKNPQKTTGQRVEAGEQIAEIGPCYRYEGEKENGRYKNEESLFKVTGKDCSNPPKTVTISYKKYIPHLHFGINTKEASYIGYSSNIGNWVDPIKYLNEKKPYSGPTIYNQAVVPYTSKPGDILEIYYWIKNPNNYRIESVKLKAQIIKSGTEEMYIDDLSNEVLISIEPNIPAPGCQNCVCNFAGGQADCYYVRKFRIPSNLSSGKYDVKWEINVNNPNGLIRYYKEVPKAISVIASNERRPGDLNGDGRVNMQDASILMSYWGSTNRPAADLNQDGIVNLVDVSIMLSNWYNP